MLGNRVIRITIIIACLGIVGAAQAELVGYWAFDEGAGTVVEDGCNGFTTFNPAKLMAMIIKLI